MDASHELAVAAVVAARLEGNAEPGFIDTCPACGGVLWFYIRADAAFGASVRRVNFQELDTPGVYDIRCRQCDFSVPEALLWLG